MEKINAILIMEVLGKPKEYLKEILEGIVDKISKIEEVKIVNKKIAEPKELENNKDLYTSFAEVEIETDMIRLMSIVFNFMPSHVEIVTPENLRITNSDMNMFFNELAKRLHQYDEIAKTVLMERAQMAEMIKQGKIKIESEKNIEEIISPEKVKKKKKSRTR